MKWPHIGGARCDVMLDLMEEGSVKPGAYVIVHNGFVIQTLDREVERTLEIRRKILENMEV